MTEMTASTESPASKEGKPSRHVSRRERRIRRRLRGVALVAWIPGVFVMAALSIELVEYRPIDPEEELTVVDDAAMALVQGAVEEIPSPEAIERAGDLRLIDAGLVEHRQKKGDVSLIPLLDDAKAPGSKPEDAAEPDASKSQERSPSEGEELAAMSNAAPRGIAD